MTITTLSDEFDSLDGEPEPSIAPMAGWVIASKTRVVTNAELARGLSGKYIRLTCRMLWVWTNGQ